MSGPSDEQKNVLLQQLDAMDPAQWLAMVRWYREKFLEDQAFCMKVIVAEASRRKSRHEAVTPSGKTPAIDAFVLSVFADLGLKMVVT